MHTIRLKRLVFSNILSYGDNINEVIFSDGLTWIKGPNGAGKEQPLDALICTPSGFIQMGDIELNQLISNPDGTNSRVIGIYPQGIKDVYKVTLNDGSSTECGIEHLWSGYFTGCKQTNGVYTTKEIIDTWDLYKNRKGNHYKGFVLPSINPVVFDDNSTQLPINPYVLGVLLGDGSFRSGDIRIASADSYIIDKVSDLLVSHNCKLSPRGKYGHSIITKYKDSESPKNHNTLNELIRELGLYGTNSLNKFIPNAYKYASIHDRMELLKGLIDTDGTVDKRGCVYYYTTSESLRDDVKFIVESLGGYVNVTSKVGVYRKDGVLHKCSVIYNLYIKIENPNDIISLPRKIERLRNRQNNSRIIKSIELVGKKECQCIRVDNPNHLYITDNFIPTHNSTCIEALTFAFFGKPYRAINKEHLRNTANKSKLYVLIEFDRIDCLFCCFRWGVFQKQLIRIISKYLDIMIFVKSLFSFF